MIDRLIIGGTIIISVLILTLFAISIAKLEMEENEWNFLKMTSLLKQKYSYS